MSTRKNIIRACFAAVVAIGLAACGGGSDTKSDAELEMERLAAAESACTGASGQWNADNTCTSAEELRAAAVEMACTDAGGRYEADGSCTPAADVEAEELAAAEMACTSAGGRWESDNMCTSAADVLAEVARANCEAGGGRYESDNTCTSAADLEVERLAGLETDCTDAGGRWESDNMCTSAAELAEMDCTDAGGRWESDNMCTSAAELAEMDCTDAGGRWESDNMCTSAADLEVERLAGLETDCTDVGGRWNADDTCSTVADLAQEQRDDIGMKINAALNAVNAVMDDSDDATVTAADTAVMAASTAIEDAADIDASEKAAFNTAIGAIQSSLGMKKSSRQMAMEADDSTADETRAATAAKLYAGISRPVGDGTGNDDRFAAYNTAETAIEVTIGTGAAPGSAVTLSVDKDTTVTDHYGWEGKRYIDPAGGDSYEAVVYSNVEAPMEGKKFGGATANDEFEYALTSGVTTSTAAIQNGEVGVVTTTTGIPARVALTGVTRTSGTETFTFSPNADPTTQRIPVPGSFHGVSGTYYCQPTTRADGCMASVATGGGFTLVGGTWAFKPTNPNARVTSASDDNYASYGWWLKKAMNDGPFDASVFHDFKGTAATVDIANLVGTARYVGGAAGKYALASSTGGTNDAGHFTARAILDADFGDDMIEGTIDMIRGADGQLKNWSVKLNKAAFGDDGVITTPTTDATVWTINEDAAAASGEWLGNLREEGDDEVPKVATGTFYSTYDTAGEMVGAFGANVQEQ